MIFSLNTLALVRIGEPKLYFTFWNDDFEQWKISFVRYVREYFRFWTDFCPDFDQSSGWAQENQIFDQTKPIMWPLFLTERWLRIMPRASGVFLVTFVRNTDEGCRRFIGESLTVFFTPLLQIQSNPKLDSKTKNSKNSYFSWNLP